MPELPEVEMVVRHLRALIAGRRIAAARLLRPGLAPDHSPRQFAALLRNTVIDDVGRRGKHILIHLSRARTLLVHLRMTGRFLYLDDEADNPRHTHALFRLDNQKKLVFVDQRQFGTMLLTRTADHAQAEPLRRLAPEPFSGEFSADYLYSVLRGSRQPIKLLLLDQTKVLGLGNIYAAEVLYGAGINPKLAAGRLARARAAALHGEIIRVLSAAIEHESRLSPDPGEVGGSYTGEYGALVQVYEREGMPCSRCARPIRRITQGGRSTYYCPGCQAG